MNRRVVITGMAGVTSLGNHWDAIAARLKTHKNAVKYTQSLEQYHGLLTRLTAPLDSFELPKHYQRKQVRSMGLVAKYATVATDLALQQSGLLGKDMLTNGATGVAFGSSTGSMQAARAFSVLFEQKSTLAITANTYVQLMPATTAVNVGIFFGLRGRVIPTSSACTSGSQAIGYAFEAIKHGYQTAMVAGGADELCPTQPAVFDTLYATSQKNDTPEATPRPFDTARDGIVIGEGAGCLILEEYEHAKARGATIFAEIAGFSSNCDAAHITDPKMETMQICMERALENAGISPSQIGYVSAHGTATSKGDIAETHATANVFGPHMPISSLKSFFGHTLGACGAIEAWLAIEMMNEGWFSPTLNLENIDPECGELDYIRGEERFIDCEYVMTNNFAFGGVNTSLIFKKFAG